MPTADDFDDEDDDDEDLELRPTIASLEVKGLNDQQR